MKPSFTVYNDNGAPSLERWHIIKTPLICLYLHRHCGDDREPLHDHPWHSLSLCIKGSYWEHIRSAGVALIKRRRWDLVYRKAETPHRIKLHRNADGSTSPAWTLFLTGPKVRDWGFYLPSGWRAWWECVDLDNPGKMKW